MQLQRLRPGVLTAAADALDLGIRQLVFFRVGRVYITIIGMLPVAGKAGAVHARVGAHRAMQAEIAMCAMPKSVVAVAGVG